MVKTVKVSEGEEMEREREVGGGGGSAHGKRIILRHIFCINRTMACEF